MVVSGQNKLQRLSLVGASLLVAQMLLGAKPSMLLTVEKRRQPPLALHFCGGEQDRMGRALALAASADAFLRSMGSGFCEGPYQSAWEPAAGRALTFCAASRYCAEVKETSARLLAQPDMRMPHLSARE